MKTHLLLPRRGPVGFTRLFVWVLLWLLAAGSISAQGFLQQTGAANPFNSIGNANGPVPTLADLDGDGDLDLVTVDSNGNIGYHRNTGTRTAPTYTASASPIGLPSEGVRYYMGFQFGDLDGDGDLDAVTGNSDGVILAYRNTGSRTSPAFTQLAGASNPFATFQYTNENYSYVSLADFDGDGDLDLLVMTGRGIHYLRNTGSPTTPSYTEITGADNPFPGVVQQSVFYQPDAKDMDGDGDPDLAVAAYSGNVDYYQNTGTRTAPVFVRLTGAANPFSPFPDTYSYLQIGLGDVDGDGDVDAVLGISSRDYSGPLIYLKNVLRLPQQPTPASQTVCVGSSASTTVQATGDAPVTYQWYRNAQNTDTPVPNQTTNTLSLNSVLPRDAGTYYAQVTGGGGNLFSTAFTLTVPGVAITQQPVSGSSVCVGTTVTAFVNTAGTATGYQWYRNGGLVSGQTSATLTLPNTDTAQSGSYQVVVTSSCNSVTSTAFILTVNPYATVSITPSATAICAGQSATLQATPGLTSYRWSSGQTTASISATATGTYSLTATNANGCSATASASVTVNTNLVAPGLQASATSTTNQPISITATGCAGGTINWLTQGGTGTASGAIYTLSQPGNYTLSATCTIGTCTSNPANPLALQIRPGGFAITAITMVNCTLFDEAKQGYQVRFTPLYAGANTNPISFSVVNELAPTTNPAPYSIKLYTDNPAITLVANQVANPEARFVYNWWASCQSGTSPNRPPTTSGIPNQSLIQNQPYQLQLTSYFADPDGQALTFSATGLPSGLSLSGSLISGTPSQTGVSTVGITALDPGGLSVSTQFQLVVNPAPTQPTGFTIVGVTTVLPCEVLSAGQRRVTFNPQYAGLDGSPVSFSVVNEMLPTTSPGPYSLTLYTDNPLITLSARQGSAISTYAYNWLTACSSGARRASAEAGSGLQVRVLGNPVLDNQVKLEVRGAGDQPLRLSLTNLQGQPVSEQLVESAGAIEHQTIGLGSQPSGVLLLQVSTATQRQTVKVIKP